MKKVFLLFTVIFFCFAMNVQGQTSISFSDSTNIVPDQLDGFKKANMADLGGTQMALNI